MSLIARAIQHRSADMSGWGPYADGTIPPPSIADGDIDLPVGEHDALHLTDAYACITLLADSISQLPFGGFRRDGVFRLPVEGTIVEQPDPDLTPDEYLGQLGHSLATRGEAFSAHLEYDRRGYPRYTRAISPDDVQPGRDKDGRIVFDLRNGERRNSQQMMHIKLHPTPAGKRGLSPIECNRRGLRLSAAAERFGGRWFTDGAAPSSVLETDKDLSDDQARLTQAKWIAAHQGRRRPAVLAGGLKWKATTITPNESQFLETRKLNTAATARIWRVPPWMIGDVEKSTSWGTGIEQQGIGFVVYTLGVYLTRIEQAFSSPRMSPRGQFAKFNVGGLLRGDTKSRYLSYAIGRQWGWLSVNDIRALEDLPPVEGGDVYLQPLNMIDAEKALQALLDGAKDGGSDA